MQSLRPGGHLALLWSATPLGAGETEPWQQRYRDVFAEWVERMDATDRLPADFQEHLDRVPHEKVLLEAGFIVEERYEYTGTHEWSVAELMGLIYSTSLLPRVVLGDQARVFEIDFEQRMLEIEPSGVFREVTSFAYDLARRPAAR
jgi:hypothetical protein